MTVKQYLRRPYARVLTPDEDGYCATMLEFPGCISQGDTAVKALANLERAAAGWLEACLNMGQSIPEPIAENPCSGRLLLRLPRAVHRAAMLIAQREAVSLNQWIVGIVSRAVGNAE